MQGVAEADPLEMWPSLVCYHAEIGCSTSYRMGIGSGPKKLGHWGPAHLGQEEWLTADSNKHAPPSLWFKQYKCNYGDPF